MQLYEGDIQAHAMVVGGARLLHVLGGGHFCTLDRSEIWSESDDLSHLIHYLLLINTHTNT